MSKKIKATVLLLSLSLLFSMTVFPTYAEAALPSVSAQSAVLIEAESGSVIWEKQKDKRLPMASTTKIMTALVALSLASPDTVIVTDPGAVGVEGSSVYLFEGETLTLEQLLYALLLESANDAAAAIAIGLSGSIEAFADEMNQKAWELGLRDTHFTNPHGLDHEEHYTTARDLALITRALLQNELLSTIVSTRKTTIPHQGTEGVRLLVNHNKMMRIYQDCICVKTGFTKRSGRCLVSAAQRDGLTLIAVTLNAPDDWDDHTEMLDYGFEQYHSVSLCVENQLLCPLSLVGGKDAYVMLSNPDALTVSLPRDSTQIQTVIECRRFEFAPVATEEILGRAVFLCDTNNDGALETVGAVPLIALYTVEKYPVKQGFWQWLMGLFS
ncbi:MAG: D-alanyl-D-alanine carboxypeptidase [Clostridia bacterium]|nr:D-alanyl-D-alanine carboxypeptidase [Clostridia bacterium]